MALKKFNPTSPSQRNLVLVDKSALHKGGPVKKLTEGLNKTGGCNNSGHVTSWQKGGGHKRRYRLIDFKRTKTGVEATVDRIEYDPNRTAFIALINYDDGVQSYILHRNVCPLVTVFALELDLTSSPVMHYRWQISSLVHCYTMSS